ncbi:MAG: Ig-like domain-containing protein [Clostridiaceae bacterium]|nr:Ig-like domain-containing protein [Clostridiaceae bacterium]
MEEENKSYKFHLGKLKVNQIIVLLLIVVILIATLSGIILGSYAHASKVKNFLQQGDNYLQNGKYEEALLSFNKAVSADSKNKDIYLEIKDLYIKAKRQDDALHFLKLALVNKVEDEGIKRNIEKIKKGFEVTKIELSCYQNDSFKPSEKVTMKINNEEISVQVKWDITVIDTTQLIDVSIQGTSEEYDRKVLLTVKVLAKILAIKDIKATITQGQAYTLPAKLQASMSDNTIMDLQVTWDPIAVDNNKVGTQNFLGTVEKYEKKVQLNLTVNAKPVVKSLLNGYVQRVYEDGGKRYLEYDEIQFLNGDAAIAAAKKNGETVDNDYYIVNSSKALKTYEISKNAAITLVNLFLEQTQDDLKNVPVSYDQFKNYINSDKSSTLCKIQTANDVVLKVDGVYLP